VTLSIEKIGLQYWRIRSRCNDRDFSDETWARSEAGIWYGAWTAEDFNGVRNDTESRSLKFLNSLPAQQALGWDVKPLYLKTALRFANIGRTDWVLMYVPRDQAIGMARLEGKMESNSHHPCNYEGEVFKYRKIVEKKTFKLSDLPDAYRLLSAQGRSNVHEFHGMREHVELLGQCSTANDLHKAIGEMSFENLLDFFGPSAWESFCFAYLIMEENFVPTGLSIGRTLKDVDIVGRRRTDGRRIVAQCKKHPSPQPIDSGFLSAITSQDIAYYFAYGGISGEVPSGTKIITKADAYSWAMSHSNGQLYRKLLLGEPV
jgi:hypothetical protein